MKTSASLASYSHDAVARRPAPDAAKATPEEVPACLANLSIATESDAASMQVLLVSAMPDVRRNLREKLSPLRWRVQEASSGSEAIERLFEAECHVMLVDSYLPDLDAAEFIRMVESQFPSTQVVTLAEAGQLAPSLTGTAFPKADDAYQRPDVLPRAPYPYSYPAAQNQRGWGEIIGTSAAMQRVYHAARLVSRRDTTVLILGESGTGKDLVARALHAASPRDKQPFIVINCAAIPEPLLEAELFGYTKGSFTGAVQSRIGRIHAAHGGTLFLDEIGDMPYPLQSKILRFLEGGEVQRLGGTETLKVDCRVIAATNVNLKQRAQAHQFREDLYYRLAVFPIRVPPLRERMEDLGSLTESFLQRFCPGLTLTPEAWQLLCSHTWPGNVRELRNVIERASLYAEAYHEVRAEDIILE